MPRIAPPTILALCLVVGCGVSGNDTVCTLEARAGINVVVTDSVTGSLVTTGVTLIVQDGAFSDSATMPTGAPPAANSLGSAYEREGTYSVTVRADNYKTWNTSGVRVKGGECHVEAVSLSAKLQRA